MQHTEFLAVLGFGLLILLGLCIIVPYLRNRSDILTSWNYLLMGCALFTGFGSLEAVYGEFHWKQLQWFQPSKALINQYVLGAVVFYAALLFFYFGLSFPKKIMANRMRYWPPIKTELLIYVLAVCLLISLGAHFVKGGGFLNPLFQNLAHKAIVFATVFAFIFWYRNKINLPLLGVFIAVLLSAALFSMVIFVGRRLLLSIICGPIIAMYWIKWRYRSPVANMVVLAGVVAVAFLVGGFYSTFRHFDKQLKLDRTRTFSNVMDHVKQIKMKSVMRTLTYDSLHYAGQYNTHYSLLTMYLVEEDRLELEPLHTLAFLGSYPIPRTYWADKPRPLGGRMTTVLRMPNRGTNWGVGVIGQCFQEGGLAVHVLYAFLAVLGVRFLDEPLIRQPDNPFLISMSVAAFPHLVGWARGDLGIMTIEVIECYIFAVLLSWGGRLLFGTEKPQDQVVALPHAYDPAFFPQHPAQTQPQT